MSQELNEFMSFVIIDVTLATIRLVVPPDKRHK